MKGDIVEKKGLWRVVSSNMLNRMELRMFGIPNGILVWWTMHTQSQAMLHSLKHGLPAAVWSMQVIMSTWHKRGLPRASWDLQPSPAPCNWHGSQLHDCVLPSFLKMFVPQGIRWLQIWGVFFIFTYVTYVFIQFYTPLVGIMSSAQSRAWSCHPCYETNGCFIFRECQCVLLGTAWIDWTRPNDTNTTFQVSTPLITWCLTVYSMSDFLLLFQVRSSSSSESPPSSSNGHGRQWLRSSFFLFFLILSLAAAASTGCPSHLEIGFCWSMVVWPVDACSIP